MCLDLCVSAVSLYSTAKAPYHVVLFYKHKGAKQHPLLLRIPLRSSFLLLFSFPLVSDIWGIPLWMCNMIWGERERERARERERERLVPAGFHVILCAHISQPCFTVVGSWLIVGPLSSFRHAWPTLISLVYCKPPLITLNTIKANILITACLIISSHRENERFQPHLCNRSYAAQK